MSKDNIILQILEKTTNKAIIQHYWKEWNGKKGTFLNPFKPEKTPSFVIGLDAANEWKFKAHNSHHQGDAFQFVAYALQLDNKTQFKEVCERIIIDLNLPIELQAKCKFIAPELLDDYTPQFIDYWAKWKVDVPTLHKYGVKQVSSHKVEYTDKKTGEIKTIKNNYASAVVACFFSNGKAKLMIPILPENTKWTKGKNGDFSKRIFKEQSNTDIFGVATIAHGEDVFICEGEKDALVLAAQGFSAISFQSATARPMPEQINAIKEKAKNVFVCYDTDAPGKEGAKFLSEKYGLYKIDLPGNAQNPEMKNDIADYFQTATTADFDFLKEAAMKAKPVEKENGGDLLQQVRQLYKMPKFDREGNLNDIRIKQVAFYDLLNSFGFYVFEREQQISFVRVEKNIVEPVSEGAIQSYFFNKLETLPEMIDENVSFLDIKETLYKQNSTLFSTQKLSLLKRIEKDFCTDTKDAVFLYFKNGFVKVQKDNWELLDYTQLDSLVWKNQLIERDFEVSTKPILDLKNAGIFSQYLFNVSAQNENRLRCLCSLIGYSLHYYFAVQRRAVLLTDSKIEGENNGRTGKTILIQAIQGMKPNTKIDGKKWDSEKFPFQEVTQQTQVIILDDVKQNFSIEPLFNDITDKVKVEQKGKTPFSLFAKFVIASNRPIKVEGASARGRVVEFEFAEYYSDTYGAVHEFGKMFFTDDFTKEDWNDYYNVMCYCIKHYFEVGLQIPENKNLGIRKLINETNEDFVEWMDTCINENRILHDTFIDKKTLHEDFLNSYPDYKENKYLKQQRYFTEYLKKYIALSGKLEVFNKINDTAHSGAVHSIKFRFKAVEKEKAVELI